MVHIIKNECDVDELNYYRRRVGGVMAALYMDVLSPIYKEHPELIPPEMKEWLCPGNGRPE